jgi:hypothetical protein
MKKLLVASLLFALPHFSWAQLVMFSATLDGAQSGTASPGTGTAWGSIDTATNFFTLNYSFSGLLAPETAAHVHRGFPGVNGPVVIGAPSFPLGSPIFYTTTISDAVEASLLANQLYLNVHSTLFPAGEIRGQLLMAVPEPSTYALAGVVVLGAVIYCRRRRVAARRV